MGGVPYLDYLIVQLDENEMRGEYINTLFDKAVVWVELQRVWSSTSAQITKEQTTRVQAPLMPIFLLFE